MGTIFRGDFKMCRKIVVKYVENCNFWVQFLRDFLRFWTPGMCGKYSEKCKAKSEKLRTSFQLGELYFSPRRFLIYYLLVIIYY
jgi:hypothetical protein